MCAREDRPRILGSRTARTERVPSCICYLKQPSQARQFPYTVPAGFDAWEE
jgi:hypothetical protein